ncbi:uncharacterized protein UTRI_04505_B [Ustilago trichophora]|uniref:Uncharacterized protein n=1 Tax=Ustilago trichophora TaxID=86804 RepID=A0A5C3EBQ8_9BASI|nr:uncharacterized protein UTRI_04505_B [Ustilago trichophora]
MADIALDYGSAEADPSADPVAMQDDAMDDAGAPTQAQNSRFYALPIDQAVEAGAQRGPAPLSSAADSLDNLALMGQEDAFVAQDPPAVESGSDIRLDTLLIEGLPITQLSTSRLFAYLTHFGAQPLGLEWIDDQRCRIVFADERSARLGMEYLCPPPSSYLQITDEQPIPLPNIETLLEYEPDSWHSEFITSLVLPRRAHRVPGKMYNHVERQAALTELEERKRSEEAVSSLPDDVPEIYREMEEADRQAKLESRELRDLRKLRGSLWLRHAVTDVDRKESRASTKSQWYKRHGYEAGREIVPKLLQVGEVRESVELFPNYRPSDDSQGRGRKRGGDDRRSAMDALDSELDRHVASRDEEPQRRQGEMMADAVQSRQTRHRRRDDEDLFDRLSTRGRGRRGEPSSNADGKWGHDAYESLEFSSSSSSSNPRRSRNDRRRNHNLDAMDEEPLDLERSHRPHHQRELSPSRTHTRHDSARDDPGRVKMKGRGRMKAPGLSSFDDRWDDTDNKRSLAKRMGGGDLLGRLGGSGQSLADRFS